MNIMTIATEDWLDSHLFRWIRFAKASNPNAKFYLVAIGNPDVMESTVVGMFDAVKVYPREQAVRDFYNQVRMSATSIFGVDEMLYCDCDADILEDLTCIAEIDDKLLSWCISPAESEEWKNYAKSQGYEPWMANNGLLYLRGDLGKEYADALAKVTADGLSERMRGTYAFNVMIRGMPDRCCRLPDTASVIWWNVDKFIDAKVIQYCSNEGQAKRLALEQEWRNACG